MKKILIISFLIITILASCFNISYAKITVTEEALQNAFNQIIKAQSTGENDDSSITFTNIKVDSTNKKITFSTLNGNSYNLSYDLSNNPIFSNEILIKEGMSYEDYREKIINVEGLPFICYAATVMTTGISLYDALVYAADSQLEVNASSNQPILTFPTTYEDGVIEYFDACYPINKETLTDSNLLNTFTITYEIEILTETSRKLKYTIIVNPDADFSKISSYLNDKYPNYPSDKNENTNTTTKPTTTPEVLPESVLIIPPTQTRYKVGEKLNLDGLKITAVYDNNVIKEIKDGYTVKGYNKNKEGKQTITISYKGFSRSYEVRVGNISYNVESEGKLPQTGNFSYLQTVLYLLIGVLSIALIYLVYKSFKYRK